MRAGVPAPTLALAAALLVGGCGEAPETVTVGSKNFTEQNLLGEILAVWIERTTDLHVARELHLGGTFICHRALLSGEIDAYVEYTGTALTAVLEREPVGDADSVYRAVDAIYRERFGLAWLPPLGFENTFAMLVRRRTADSLGLETLSDAVPHARRWRPGFGYEFLEREDGLPGLRRAYGLEFGDAPVLMDLQLTYRALAEGRVDLIAGNSTDGRIEGLELVQLEDDRGFFPPYEAAPVVRMETLERHPALREALQDLGGRIDTGEMRRLNRLVDVEGRDFREVAREWVGGELEGTPLGPDLAGRRSSREAPPARRRRGYRSRISAPRARSPATRTPSRSRRSSSPSRCPAARGGRTTCGPPAPRSGSRR